MEAGTVMEMLEEMGGREAVANMNARMAFALYQTLVMHDGEDENRVARMAHDLGVSPKTIYAWTSNRATPPVRALTYCVERWGSCECMAALLPEQRACSCMFMETVWVKRNAVKS